MSTARVAGLGGGQSKLAKATNRQMGFWSGSSPACPPPNPASGETT